MFDTHRLNLALISMITAVARPAALVTLPYQYETVILAIDASGSMRSADVSPTRIAAAQAAARSFVADQPRNTRLAVVLFAAAGAVFALLSGSLSLLRFNRIL